MVAELINANPVVYERKERRVHKLPAVIDEYAQEPIDQQEIFDHIRDIKDPEHPYSLEQLNVVTDDAIEVNDEKSHVRVTFTPTVEHCSMATIIGLCLRVKLIRSLPSRYKVCCPAVNAILLKAPLLADIYCLTLFEKARASGARLSA
ncbi:protein AE7-like isoform X3 [Ananas comosus]|uniref:Protein AE7-like isoform X3 n=1 Tax=Ananas comosus TaxID=4615 RepID=A0A6P5GRM9_ANACO|nr:protein AE7-like isoform X3 [Ananas comosus]